MKLNWIIPLFAAAGLALAGCGGGGSSSSTSLAPPSGGTPPMDDTDTTPPEPTVNDVDLSFDMPSDYAAPSAGSMTVLAGATYTPEDSDVTFSCPAGGEDCEIEIAADGTVTSTGGAATAALTMAAADRLMEEQAVAAAELKDRATGLFSALTDADGDYGEEIRANEKNSAFSISRGLSGMAMVSDGGKSGWSTMNAPNAVAGYQGTVLDNGKTQTFTVYTDIEAAKRKPYDDAYSNDGTTTVLHPVIRFGDDGTTGSGITVTAEPSADTDPPKGQLGLDATQMQLAANRGLLDNTKFPQPKDPGKGVNSFEYGPDDDQKLATFKGTFHGASGTYACTAAAGANCTVAVTAPSTQEGPEYTVTGAAWTFTPDRKNAPRIVEQDRDYMYFGWWIDTPKTRAVGDEFLYDAQVFFGGNMPFSNDAADKLFVLQGDATYTGPAAGRFAVTGDDAAFGEFTASASLTAKFGTNATTGTAGSVSGTISKFVRDDGVANDWALALGAATISGTAGTPTPATDGSGTGNIVDGIDRIGSWAFQLYGPGTNGANPSGIAGAFNAEIDDNTAVAGGFAAK